MIKSPDLKMLRSGPAVLLRDVPRPNRNAKLICSMAIVPTIQKSSAILAAAAVGIATLALAGCQSAPKQRAAGTSVAAAIPVMQRVNARAYECWVKSGDPAFKKLALIPELDTRVGKPRILVVDRGKPQGLPKLVIEAVGRGVTTYGPLTAQPVAARINGDVGRWAAGETSCGAQA